MNRVQIDLPTPKYESSPSQFNNQYAAALAMGDPRMAAKQYDRAGLSRGRAQWNQAGIDAAQKMADGVAEAYGTQLANNVYNSNAQLQSQQANEAYGQALGGLNQQSAYANQMAALQRQGTVMNLLSGLLR